MVFENLRFIRGIDHAIVPPRLTCNFERKEMKTGTLLVTLWIAFANAALAADCIKETGKYTGEGMKATTEGRPPEPFAFEVELTPNGFNYSRTFRDGHLEGGDVQFVCNPDGTIDWPQVENGEGEWEEGVSFELRGTLGLFKITTSFHARDGAAFFATTHEFEDGKVVRYLVRATKQ
jgi:hypothetical protein